MSKPVLPGGILKFSVWFFQFVGAAHCGRPIWEPLPTGRQAQWGSPTFSKITNVKAQMSNQFEAPRPQGGASRKGNFIYIVPLPACRQAGTPPIPLGRAGALAGQMPKCQKKVFRSILILSFGF
jgi:hypothetical protein